ncbi:unnamed protein product [Citrullus colocynthis]|uniref:Uncharacterized protein n=1 Tax=Citrullus colocynthis TaxID=252529 RepID=A0ABP0Y3Y5_9ROSI
MDQALPIAWRPKFKHENRGVVKATTHDPKLNVGQTEQGNEKLNTPVGDTIIDPDNQTTMLSQEPIKPHKTSTRAHQANSTSNKLSSFQASMTQFVAKVEAMMKLEGIDLQESFNRKALPYMDGKKPLRLGHQWAWEPNASNLKGIQKQMLMRRRVGGQRRGGGAINYTIGRLPVMISRKEPQST